MVSPSNILYSCYVTRNLSNEQFIPEHIFLFQISGSLTINDSEKEYNVKTGEFCLARRNRLAKYIKIPPENGEYKTISIRLDQSFLKKFSNGYGYEIKTFPKGDAVIKIESNDLLKNYINSLKPYLNENEIINKELSLLKTKEIVLILLKTNPNLKNVLFDFSEPGKIDLEAFMNQNFKFNVSMERFGYLSGRSLASFKRDFSKIFNSSPGRWLLQKRLNEAHYLIEKRKQKPSEAYLEVGFENLSHFSFAFKQHFGYTPKELLP